MLQTNCTRYETVLLDPDREYDSNDPKDMLEYALNLSLQNDD